MTPRAVVVIHGEVMVAEALAAALAPYPAIMLVGVATSVTEGEPQGGRADSVALDRYLSGAQEAAHRLRLGGVRVVLLGESVGELDNVCVSLRAPVSALARALVPESSRGTKPVRPLTVREREVLVLAAGGLTAGQVARRLGISTKTVEQRKARAFAKLGVTNQAAAVRVALAGGGERWLHPVRAAQGY
jgi:DNA-binding CsgD family transcriptional regulator